MIKKTKYRKGHYIIKKGEEIYHIVKKAMHRTENTWGIYRQSKDLNGDGYLRDYNGGEIWVRFGTGCYVTEHLFDNSFTTLKEAERIVLEYCK